MTIAPAMPPNREMPPFQTRALSGLSNSEKCAIT